MTHFCLHSPKKTVCHGPAALVLATGAALWACPDQLAMPPAFALGWKPPQTANMQQPKRSPFGSEHDPQVAATAFPGMHDRRASGYWQMMTVVGTIVAAAQLVQRRTVAQSRARVDAEKAILVSISTACASACGPSVLGKGLTGADVPFFAVRGSAAAGVSARGAKLVVKNGGWTKRGPYRLYRNEELYRKWAYHKKGLPSQQFRKCKEYVMHLLKSEYKQRRVFKRTQRRLWIIRVAANCKLHGVRYSQFISHLYRNDIILNRKILSQLGVYDRSIFTNIMNLTMPNWQSQLDRKMNPPKKEGSTEEMDDVVLTHIEKKFPELYTSPCIRFNRRVRGDSLEYTVDVGDPDEWRKLLPKSPELANFNLPDHFVKDANLQREVHSLFAVMKIRNEDPLDDEFVKAQKMYAKKLAREEALAEAGEPVPPKKEGMSRDDWFDDEPQSWY